MYYLEIENCGRILRGMYHEGKDTNSFPVIIVHGYFSANRIGPQRLFVKLANTVANLGFHVYRFDLSGMGESDGDINNITFNDHVSDVHTILEFVKNRHHGLRITAIAHCLGCNVTLANINYYPEMFREVIFLAPYFTTQEVLNRFFSTKAIEQLISMDYTYRKGLYVHASFFKSSKQTDFVNMLKKTTITLNVIIPEEDQFIPLHSNKEVFDQINIAKMIYLPKSDHNFLETNDILMKMVKGLLTDEKFTI